MDGYPGDQARTTRQMQRDIASAQGSAGLRPPLLEASKGWIFTDMATPDTPPAGKTHIYSQGGRLWASSTAGAVPLLLPDYPQAPPISDLPSRATVSAPGSYSSAWAGNVLSDLTALFTWANALQTSLEAGDILLPL
ncbi:hypothetical protein GCM10017673_15030 [Streptosporangium violaceochromogenes]|nr:hypothetical protein GCM10017673_15030 [Streptosporangium violaceochromogenes]